MSLLLTLCIIVSVVGVLLILFGALAPTSVYVPQGIPAGITLLVIGIVLYVILTLIIHPVS